MSYYKIHFQGRKAATYVCHSCGSQMIYSAIDEVEPDLVMPNGVPASIEADGWADDQAAPGDVFSAETFTIDCITEEEFRKATGQEDIPTHLLESILVA